MNNVLYENIKKRRQELHMSQQELAESVGYSGKSMISQVEKGLIDIPSTMITKFADALNCTESYLMGWEDEDPTEAEMDAKANYLWELYTNASPEVQSAVETLLRAAKHD